MRDRVAALALLLSGVCAAALVTAPAAPETDAGYSTGRMERKVMFSACSPGHPGGPGLFVANSDFTNPIRLTTPRPDLPVAASDPGVASGCDIGAWSPDGTRVALSRNMYLYLLDLKALLEYAVQHQLGVIAIKAISGGQWQQEEHDYSTWYRPFDDPEYLARALRFTLSQPVTTAAAAGDARLLKMLIAAAESFTPLPAEEQEQLLASAGQYRPLFGEE